MGQDTVRWEESIPTLGESIERKEKGGGNIT